MNISFIIIIGLIIIVILGIIYYETQNITSLNSQTSSYGTQKTTNLNSEASQLILQGDYENQAITITNQTEIDIQGDSDNFTISIPADLGINVTVQGNNNIIRFINGRIALVIQGDYDSIYTENTTILSRQVEGNGDSVS